MKIKPMPFNADMTMSIWEGQKTVTRRPVKFTVQDVYGAACFRGLWYETYNPACPPEPLKEWYVKEVCRPKYQPGEIVYVPEAWKCEAYWVTRPPVQVGYRVQFRDGDIESFYFDKPWRGEKFKKYRWKPREHWQSPYFMPREAARLFLRVTGVRVERLQDITEDQAKTEGANFHAGIEEKMRRSAIDRFQEIWDSTVKPKDRDLYGWAANPWVWVIKFERISREEAMKA